MTYTIPRLLTHTTLHTLTHTYTRTHTLTHIHLHKWPHLLRLSLCTTTSWSGCAISDSSSVLQCVAVCCSVLQCVAACCSVLQRVSVCFSVLQCVAVCCSVLQCVAVRRLMLWCVDKLWSCLEKRCYDVLKIVVTHAEMPWARFATSDKWHQRCDVTSEMWRAFYKTWWYFPRSLETRYDVLKCVMKSWNSLWYLETRCYHVLKNVMMSWKALLTCWSRKLCNCETFVCTKVE